jgi:hypothetical protein
MSSSTLKIFDSLLACLSQTLFSDGLQTNDDVKLARLLEHRSEITGKHALFINNRAVPVLTVAAFVNRKTEW